MRVGIIIDNPTRDLQGSVLIARELVKRGFEAVLIPMYQQGTDVPLVRLHAIILNYARLNNLELMHNYHTLGIPLFILDTEGGILSKNGADDPKNWAQGLQKSGTSNLISGYFFWGNRIFEAFRKYSGIDEKKLHVTGNPRFDMCSKRWRSLLNKPCQNYILINTNFSAINPLFTEALSSEKDLFESIGWNRQYIEKLFSDLQTVFPQYLRDLERLFAQNSTLQFLIRPHPFENKFRYIGTFKEYENVTIDPSDSVFNVINNSNCVVHLNCGTSVEAILLDKVPISLEYLNTATLRQHTPLPAKISYRAESFEQLNQAIQNIDNLAQEFDFRGIFQANIRPWFHNVDGCAAEKIADIIAEFFASNLSKPHKISFGASLNSCRNHPRPLQYLQSWANNFIGSKAGSRLRHALQPERRLKYFDADDVNQMLYEFDTIDKGERKIFSHHIRHPLSGFPLSSVHCSYQ